MDRDETEASNNSVDSTQGLRREATGGGRRASQGVDPRELAPFLNALDQYNPTIPEEVTAYFLQQAGVTVTDPKIKKLVSLAAEKLVSEIVHDTTTYSRMKDQGGETLKLEDLKESLSKYGIQKLASTTEEEGGAEEEASSRGAGAEAGGGGGRRPSSRNR